MSKTVAHVKRPSPKTPRKRAVRMLKEMPRSFRGAGRAARPRVRGLYGFTGWASFQR